MPQKNQADLSYATTMSSVVGQVGCLNILLIGLSLGAGMLIDRWLGTDGIFAAIFILSSVPIALWLTMRVSLQAVKKAQALAEKQAEERKRAEEKKLELEQENEDKSVEES